MSIRWIIALCGLALAAVLAWLLAAPGGQAAPSIVGLEQDQAGLRLAFSRRLKIDQARVWDPRGQLLLDERLNLVERGSLRLFLQWPGPGQYRAEISGPWGRLQSSFAARPLPPGGVTAQLLAPFLGLESPAKGGKAAVAAGSLITCALVIRQHGSRPSRVKGEIKLGPGLRLADDGLPPWVRREPNQGGEVLRFQGGLSAPGQDLTVIFRVATPKPGRFGLFSRVESQTPGGPVHVARQRAFLSFLPLRELARGLAISGHWLPTGLDGWFDSRNQPGVVYYKPPFVRSLARFLGSSDDRVTYWMPYTHQCLALGNNSPDQMTLVVKARIVGLHNEQAPVFFRPPDIFEGSLADRSVSVTAVIPPGESEKVVLPIFVTSPPRQGKYRRLIQIYPLGGSQALKTIHLPLTVAGMDYTAFLFTVGSLVLSLVALGFLAWRFRRLLAGLKVRQVVIIALFGALTFAGVNLPVKVFSPLFFGILGPFGIIVVGFFSELLYYALLISMVRIIPRPGVVSLLTLVRYLLAVLVTGGFHFSDFLYVGSSIAVKESALFLAGVTRKGEGFSWSWPAVSLLALCLALGDAFLSAASIYVHMILLRLYFADWYITLTVLVNGFAYTAAGVWLGKRFSDRLVWAEE